MTIKETLERLEATTDEDTRMILSWPLFVVLHPISRNALLKTRVLAEIAGVSKEHYFKLINQVYRLCVEMEVSPLGESARMLDGLEPVHLTMDTMLPEPMTIEEYRAMKEEVSDPSQWN